MTSHHTGCQKVVSPRTCDDDACESGRKRFGELCFAVLLRTKKIHFADLKTSQKNIFTAPVQNFQYAFAHEGVCRLKVTCHSAVSEWQLTLQDFPTGEITVLPISCLFMDGPWK